MVHKAWDIGAPLNTVVWYFQLVAAEFRVIDCDSDLDLTPVQRVARMLAKGYLYGSHYLPHDAMATLHGGKTFLNEQRFSHVLDRYSRFRKQDLFGER